jgi:hypothetical protein
MLTLNEKGIDVIINKINNKGLKSFWNNYDLVVWEKNISGYFFVNGMFMDDTWGTSVKFKINKDGLWRLPKKYVKYFK